MTSYLTAIVMPCLNEERYLIHTCHSLGFGHPELAPKDVVLVIVDNGSDDATLSVAKHVQRTSNVSVIIETESERGYVPPRRRGNLTAMKFAQERGVAKENLLIVQADADTTYGTGYVDSLSAIARRMGHGVLIDACSEYEADIYRTYQKYIALCNETDALLKVTIPNQEDDVVVDDKACAYWASDYETWGGHQREFTAQGDEINAETTRLYIRGKTHGARRVLCDEAIAQHSNRRVCAAPAYDFATAGFPREERFKATWQRLYDGPAEIGDFSDESNRSKVTLAIRCRQAHMIGLFQTLSLHVDLSVNAGKRDVKRDDLLPARDADVARHRPGVLIEDVLKTIDAGWM